MLRDWESRLGNGRLSMYWDTGIESETQDTWESGLGNGRRSMYWDTGVEAETQEHILEDRSTD